MKVDFEITIKDLLMFALIICIVLVSAFLYRQNVALSTIVEANSKNIRAVAVATGVLKPQPAQTPQGGDNVNK